MSGTAFTPGPWEYEPRGQMIVTDHGQKMIADIRGWGWIQYLPEGEKIQDANGYLIAATPELYEFIKDYIEAWENSEAGHSYLYGKAHDILAKARGEV